MKENEIFEESLLARESIKRSSDGTLPYRQRVKGFATIL